MIVRITQICNFKLEPYLCVNPLNLMSMCKLYLVCASYFSLSKYYVQITLISVYLSSSGKLKIVYELNYITHKLEPYKLTSQAKQNPFNPSPIFNTTLVFIDPNLRILGVVIKYHGLKFYKRV